MMDNSKEFTYSKKGKRVISNFVTQELLYDYAINKLDLERTAAVEAQLKINKDLRADLDKIRGGLRYAEKLAKVEMSDEVCKKIQVPTSYLELMLAKAKFEKWPQGLKWGLESLLVAILITVVAMFIPWDRALKLNFSSKSSYVIAELKNENINKPEVTVDNKPLYQDETKPIEGSKSVAVEAPPAPPAKPLDLTPDLATANLKNVQMPLKEAKVKKVPVEATAPVVQDTSKKEAGGGFLYRGILNTANLGVVTPKLVEELSNLGGRKAGEVELGWKKGNGSYFHFTIPQSKYEDLVKLLNSYGKLRIQKEHHERVMPDGIIRLIISVEEAGKK